jgi:hypothetical protein
MHALAMMKKDITLIGFSDARTSNDGTRCDSQWFSARMILPKQNVRFLLLNFCVQKVVFRLAHFHLAGAVHFKLYRAQEHDLIDLPQCFSQSVL